MHQGKDLVTTRERITPLAVKECRCRQIQPGTLLLSFKLSVGKLGFARIPLYTNEAIAALPIKDPDRLLADYLYYALLVADLESGTDRAVKGLTLNLDKLAEIKVPLPPLPEQRRLAALLDKANRLRRLRRYALELSDTYLQSVFLEMFGDLSVNTNNWGVEELGDLIDGFDAGVNFPPVAEGELASDWRVLKVSAVTWGEFNPDESKPISPDIEFDGTIIVRNGDLLMSRANTTELVGAVCLVRATPPKVLLPDKLWRVRFFENSRVLPEYLLFVLRHRKLRRIIGNLATGSSGSMKNISQDKATTLSILIAPVKLQEKFTHIVQKFERLRAQQREAARQAEQLFQTLLQRAFAGQV